MADAYAHYLAALDRKPTTGLGLPTYVEPGDHWENPQPGLYRARLLKNGPFKPIRIWLVDAERKPTRTWSEGCIVAGTVDGQPATFEELVHRWQYCEPVSKSDFEAYLKDGRWPGEIAEIGHNSGDLSLADEVKQVAELQKAWIEKTPVQSKVVADEGANRKGRMLEMKRRIEAEREEKIRPHLDAQRQINAEYKPLIEAIDATVRALKAHYEPFLKAEEDRIAAEAAAARRKAEEEAKAVGLDPRGVQVEPPAPVKIGGQVGRRSSLRTVTRYGFSDYKLTLQAMMNEPEVIEAVLKVATRRARAGETIPGLTAYKEKVA